MKVQVTSVSFTPAPVLDQLDGLLGWAEIAIDDALAIENVAVRRSRAGRYYLSFPACDARTGRRRTLIRPLTNEARIDLEQQVFDHLREQRRVA